MTAIKSDAATLLADDSRGAPPRTTAARPSAPPSATEEEAKTRFVSALGRGVDTLLGLGHGRERASAELLREISDGCTPDEDEVFQTMEALGISLEDATKVMTVSCAFRKAQTARGGSAVEAIDELTSRLNLASLLRGGGSSRSSSPLPAVASATAAPGSVSKMTELTRNESLDSLQSRSSAAAAAKKGPRPPSSATRAKSLLPLPHQGRGRKRALAEKTPEKRDGNVMVEENPNPKGGAAAAAASTVTADLDAKEKMINAKLAKAEGGKKAKPSAASSSRAKSPEGGLGARGKRAAAATVAALHAEEVPAAKRPRAQTEESIPQLP